MSAFLRIEHLSKAYPGVQALRNVSFDIERGHVHALIGENGAGKSTLIKILAGAEQRDSGLIWLEDKPYTPHSPRDALATGISTIYQVFNLLPDRTIMHNILLGKEPRKKGLWLDFDTMRAETRRVLTMLNAGHLSPDAEVRQLKVSEQQVVEIAKALLNRSRLLIMDEPTAALNQTEVNALFDNISVLKQEGVTILYVSHRLDEIFQLADCVTVLRDGEHISTRPIGSVTRESLVEDMIGRKLTSVFPARVDRRGDEVLRVEGLNVSGLLHDITFGLHKGEVLAVAGLSGSGKTELGKALFGDLPLDSGIITLGDRPLKVRPTEAIRNGLIYLPEDRKAHGVFQEHSVKRNVSISVLERLANRLGILNLTREQSVAQEQVRALDIKTPSLDQLVMNLSGGNQQKVALARCLAVGPEVFILMEPTQGIDVGVKFELYQFIAEQAASGRAILLISSEIAEILGLSHRVLVMREGRIVAELDTDRTSQEEILRYALGEQAAEVSQVEV
jgi:ABC-type sugar transport system ATPase subunit